MDSSNLSPDQLRRVRARVERDRGYLARLVVRMQQLGFMSDDQLFRHAMLAHDAMEKLSRATMIANTRHGQVKEADPYGPSNTKRA